MASILSITSTMSPQLAARIAYPMFVTPSPRRELRPEERRIMDEARESSVRVRSSKLSVYEWKKGPDVVLLVHGWQGRASQFNVLVRSLRARGFTVVAFDAPACGASEGTTTDIADYIDAMRKLQRIYGPFSGVVGHSFGSLAALSAINEGLDARRMVGVGTIPDAAYLLSTFAARLQLSRATVDALVERFQFTRSLGDVDIRVRFSGLKNPVKVPTLFVHDMDDTRVPHTVSEELQAAHGETSRLLLTRDYGHSAVLAAGEAIDAIVDFLAEGSEVAEQKATLKPSQIVGQQGLVAEGAGSSI
jgi:pimeloyl-ACP methyl ester carboxylesterase